MDEEKSSPQPSPNSGSGPVRKMLWLCAAFFPGAVGIACLHIKNPGQWLLPALLLLNFISSVAAGVQLVRGMRNTAAQFVLGLFLISFFFVLNAFIVLFIGCSGMGRIAP